METPRKYLALRWIGMIATVAALLVVVLSIIALLWVFANVGENWARWLLVGLLVIWGVSTFLTFFVRGTVMLLLTDLERQARANSQSVNQMKNSLDTAKALINQMSVRMEALAETRLASSNLDVAPTSKAMAQMEAPLDATSTETDEPNSDDEMT